MARRSLDEPDPFEGRFTLSIGGDSITLTVDDDLEVVEVSAHDAGVTGRPLIGSGDRTPPPRPSSFALGPGGANVCLPIVPLQTGFIEDNMVLLVGVLVLVILVIGIAVPKLRGLRRRRRERRASGRNDRLSCPRCGELTSRDQDSCPNCGKDLTT